MSRSPADFLATAQAAAAGAPGAAAANGRGGSTTPNGGASIFVPRDNPRRLFVRDPLPSTGAAGTSTASPALGATPGALRTPASGLRITPGTGRRDSSADRAGASGGGENGGYAVLAENGFGPSGGSAGGELSDAQLASLLPSLKQPEYYTEPSLQQVSGMGSHPTSAGGALRFCLPTSQPAPGGCCPAAVRFVEWQPGRTLPLCVKHLSPTARLPACPPQLAAMARDDPACLAEVANFCVGRRGVGSVRWLEPVDVRALDLDATVQLSRGSIEVRGLSRCGAPGRRCLAQAQRKRNARACTRALPVQPNRAGPAAAPAPNHHHHHTGTNAGTTPP